MLIIGTLAVLAMCLALCMASAGDRDNFSGDVSLTAPTGGYTRGLMYNVENSYLVARETVDAGEACLMALRGPVWVTKVTGTGLALAVGDKVYWISADKKVTPSATGNTLLGATVIRAAGASDTAVLLHLDTVSPALT